MSYCRWNKLPPRWRSKWVRSPCRTIYREACWQGRWPSMCIGHHWHCMWWNYDSHPCNDVALQIWLWPVQLLVSNLVTEVRVYILGPLFHELQAINMHLMKKWQLQKTHCNSAMRISNFMDLYSLRKMKQIISYNRLTNRKVWKVYYCIFYHFSYFSDSAPATEWPIPNWQYWKGRTRQGNVLSIHIYLLYI